MGIAKISASFALFKVFNKLTNVTTRNLTIRIDASLNIEDGSQRSAWVAVIFHQRGYDIILLVKLSLSQLLPLLGFVTLGDWLFTSLY